MSRTIEAVTAQRVAPPTAQLTPMPGHKLVAEWQTGLETISGCSQWKLRLAPVHFALPTQSPE